MSTKVIMSRAARLSVHNPARLEKQAVAVASALTVPPGIEFARFEHAGKMYALCARVLIEIDALPNRVPDVVIRTGQTAKITHRRRSS